MKNILYSILGSLLLLTSCALEKADDIEPFFFRTDGADLLVDIDGNIASNVFIVYLHGGPGGGSFAYNQGYFSDELEEEYAMVYLDQRGNGASQGNYDKEDLTIEQNSKDIYQLIQFLKAKYGNDISLFLAGHSWGGLTSAHALINTNLQEDVLGWIEMNGAHDLEKTYIEATKMFQKFANKEIANENNLDFWEPILEEVNKIDTLDITEENQGYLNSTAFKAEKKFDLTSTEEGSIVLPFSPRNYGFGLVTKASNLFGNPILGEDSYSYNLTERLDEIEIPCLFLWGKYDFVVPPALGESAYNLVSTTEKELVIYETSGHSPMVNEGELLTQKVKEFIELYK